VGEASEVGDGLCEGQIGRATDERVRASEHVANVSSAAAFMDLVRRIGVAYARPTFEIELRSMARSDGLLVLRSSFGNTRGDKAMSVSTENSTKRNAQRNARRDYNSPVIKKGHRAGEKPPNAGRRFPAEILTQDEVRALIGACSNRAPTGIRNRALLVMMYRGGLRLSEALALRPKDVDPDAGTVVILHGKGDRRRTLGLDPGAFAVLGRWLDRRERLGLNGHHPCTPHTSERSCRAWRESRDREASPPARSAPHLRLRALGGRGEAGAADSGSTRTFQPGDDRPVPAPHRPGGVDRDDAHTGVEPLN
jgi:integrase